MAGKVWRTASKTKNKFQPKLKVVTKAGSRVEDSARRGLLRIRKRTRKLSREQLAKMRTLHNPLLFKSLVDRLRALNPDIGQEIVDRIDRTLEYDEALNDLKKKLVNLITSKADVSKMNMKEYRDWLSEWGIDNVHLQNLVMKDDKPATEQDIAQLARAVHGRSLHARVTDRALPAPLARNFRQYANHPDRYDIRGLDTKGTRTDPSEKI